MKTALVLGINGNFGRQMAQALTAQGWSIKALIRKSSKAPSETPVNDLIVGSATDSALLRQTVQGVDLIVYGLNPPYHQWDPSAMTLLEPIAALAEELRLHILFPGNVYGFAPQPELIDESVAPHPPTDKGVIRVKMEQRLKQASENGAKVTLIRAGDFMGPYMHLGWIDHLVKRSSGHIKLSLPHTSDHQHHWSYLPDLCANAVSVVAIQTRSFEIWHDPGLQLAESDWCNAFHALGYEINQCRFPWWFFSIIAPFNPMLKEVLKMRYLWQQPILLNGDKWRMALGSAFQRTAFTDVLVNVLNLDPALLPTQAIEP